MRRQGMVLILIVGMLGLLSMVAVQMATGARLERKLSDDTVARAHLKLLTISGLEIGRRLVAEGIEDGLRDSSGKVLRIDGRRTDGERFRAYREMPSGMTKGFAKVMIMDANGAINVNDGVAAGLSENATHGITGGYKADQVDPYPGGTEDVSGIINLRLRRILNAYGDVWKFKAEYGDLPDPDDDKGTFGEPVNFTGLSDEDVGTSAPAGDGLGDAVIAARPSQGYLSFKQVKDIVNTWGQTHLMPFTPLFMQGQAGFFDIVSYDLTLTSYEDASLLRMTRDIGTYDSDPTKVDPALSLLDQDPPDLDGIWRGHSAALINMNSASREVLAALFFAPANVRYGAEGMLAQGFRPKTGSTYQYWMHPNRAIGVTAPLFQLNKIVENGYPGTTHAYADVADLVTNFGANVRKNRLITFRDALLLSRSYELYGDNHSQGAPADFVEFAACLREIRDGTFLPSGVVHPDYERPRTDQTSTFPYIANNNNLRYNFDQTYIERTLPHIFSGLRRLPSWLGAPVALVSPYLHPRITGGDAPDASTTVRPIRSVDDWVVNNHIPKVSFLPCGQFAIRVGASMDLRDNYTSNLDVVIKSFETRIWRSQVDFKNMTDTTLSDTGVVIGPEVEAAGASRLLGTVGLNDQSDPSNGDRPYTAKLEFDFNHTDPFENEDFPLPSRNWSSLDLGGDPWAQDQLSLTFPNTGVQPYDFDYTIFQNGNLEKDASHFLTDGTGGDVSPFGGLLFSSLSHGPRALNRFNDSLLFDPMQMIQASPLTPTSDTFGQGMVSFWYRVPTGIKYGHHVLMSMTLFQKVGLESNIYGPQQTFNIHSIAVQQALNFQNKNMLKNAIYINHNPPIPAQFADQIYTYLASVWSSANPHASQLKYRILANPPNSTQHVQPIHYVVYHDAKDGRVYIQQEAMPAETSDAKMMNEHLALYDGAPPFGLAQQTFNGGQIDPNSNHGNVGPMPEPKKGNPQSQNHTDPWQHDQHHHQDQHQNNHHLPGFDFSGDTGSSDWFSPFQHDQFQDDQWIPNHQQDPTVPVRDIDRQVAAREWYESGKYRKLTVRRNQAAMPGSWSRVVLVWNNRVYSDSNGAKFWMIDHNGTNASTGLTSAVPSGATYNPKMQLTFGELPLYVKDTMNFKNVHTTTLSPVALNEFNPICRADTLIDDIDVRFGNVPDFFGVITSDSTTVKNELFATNELDRYDVSFQPKWVLNPGQHDPHWKPGARVISIGARIFDPPHNTNSTIINRSPRVDLELHTGGAAETPLSPPGTVAGHLFHQLNQVNSAVSINEFTFPYDTATKKWVTLAQDSRIQAIWMPETPDGTSVSRVTNIPWIQEVSYRVMGRGDSILRWTAD